VGTATTSDLQTAEKQGCPTIAAQARKSYHDISTLGRPPGCSSRRQPAGAPRCLLDPLGLQKPYEFLNIGPGKHQLQKCRRSRLSHYLCSLNMGNNKTASSKASPHALHELSSWRDSTKRVTKQSANLFNSDGRMCNRSTQRLNDIRSGFNGSISRGGTSNSD
jgi:hypothetical protein